MNRFAIIHPALVTAILFSSAAKAAEPADDTLDMRDRVATLAQPLIDGQVAVGLAVGLIQDGKTQVFGYGHDSQSSETTPDGDTLFEIGSATKVFTSLLLADMANRKVVGLDDTVQSLLPPSVTIPKHDGHEITLLHLASHTSGLPRMPDNFAPADPNNPYADYSVEQMYDFLTKHSLPRGPGERMEYSNLGAGLLGHALALKAGVTYEELVRKTICEPLGMNRTLITLPDELKPSLAEGNDSDGNAVANWDLPTFAGAGALRSTANDMAAFLAANLGLVKTPLAEAIEISHVARHGGDKPEIALGWLFQSGGDVLWHNGQTGGYHSFMAFDKEHQTAVVVLSNSATGMVDALGIRLLELLAGGSPKPLAVRMPGKLDNAVLSACVGRYELVPGFVIAVTQEEDKLFAQATGQPKFRLFPETESEFFLRVVDAQVTFVRNDKDEVAELILHQNGRDTKGKRIE